VVRCRSSEHPPIGTQPVGPGIAIFRAEGSVLASNQWRILPLVAIDPRPIGVLQSGMLISAVGCRWMFILLAAALPVSAVYFPPPDAEGGWRCATNGQSMIRRRAGLDARRLDQAWEYNQRCSQNAGLLVVRHGWLALERYVGRANREARPDMASTGKAYTSIACGILLQEFAGRFPAGLETRVFTPEFLPEAFSPEGHLDDPRRADITLGHLLCMSGGYTGEGGAPTAVVMGRSFLLKPVPGQDLRDLDGSSLRCAMWTNAGGGCVFR